MGNIFVAIDGDGIGNQVGRAALGDDVQGLHELSIRITRIQDILGDWAQAVGGTKISGGGDEGIVSVPDQASELVEQLRKDIEFSLGFTVSVGVGDSLSHAATSLLVAKIRGKNQIATYDDSVIAEVQEAKQRVADGTASDEERKISAAYLETKGEPMAQSEHDDCEYCKETEGNEDLAHCQYCHDAEQVEGEDDCQYCQEAEGAADHEHTGDDCEYCDEAAQESGDPDSEAGAIEDENDPTAENSQDFAGADLNPPAIEKPGDDQAAPGLANTPEDATSNSNIALDADAAGDEALAAQGGDEESIFDADEHSNEAMQGIVGQLDEDDGAAVVGDNMEDNVSRPESYGENTPDDMGLSEDEVPDEESPDLSDVLQQGLDSHADNIQREKVVQMVGEALEGFKASKQVLERAKEQAPQLYQSSIAMLKAMIEMAKMLGLGEDVEQEAPGAQGELEAEGEEESPEGRPDDREPAHFGQPDAEGPADEDNARPESKEPAHFAKPASDKKAPEAAPGKKPQGQ